MCTNKNRIGVQKILYKAKREHASSNPPYYSENEDKRGSSLVRHPRIPNHNSKDNLHLNGSGLEGSSSPSRIIPYTNKNHKILKLQGKH